MSEDRFPSTKGERGRIFAKTGLKVGANYARYLAKKTVGAGDKKELNERNAKDIYREFTRLRGTALKLAQSMSIDTGILPDEYVEVMTQAQYSVPPMNRALVRKIIKDAFGKYPEQLFATFEPDATAAASIGQVHKATLKDGTPVAVKVQYPNVRDTIKSDLAIARGLFKRIIKGDRMDVYFDEIYQKLLEETDYLNEGKQIDFFAGIYDHDDIVTPHWIPELTRQNVLTMTFVDGMHLDTFLSTDPGQDRINHFGQILWDFVNQQIASNVCAVHADIHPGNFLFREDGKLGVIDFGCVKRFPQDFRDDFLLLYDAQIRRQEDEVQQLYHALEIIRDDVDDTKEMAAFYDYFRRFGETIVEPFRHDSFVFGDNYRAELNDRFREATTFNQVTGSRHFVYVNRIMMGLFSVLLKLSPTLDITKGKAVLDGAVKEIRSRRATGKAA